jgi:hypothetical protein
METLFRFVEDHWTGICILFLALVGLLSLVQWLCWIFGLGRYGKDARTPRESSLRFVIADLLVKIINELPPSPRLGRHGHLCAGPVLCPGSFGWLARRIEQSVAERGGGSIIGYYFGESAAGGRTPPPADKPASAPKPEGAPAPKAITPIPEPESLKSGDFDKGGGSGAKSGKV